MFKNTAITIVGIFIIAHIVVLSGCEKKYSDEERIDIATEKMATGNYRIAIIELKKLLQSNNSNVKARLLLGKNYLMLGDGVSAEKELRKAESIGADEDKIRIHLGRALLLQEKYNDVLNEIQPEQASDNFDKAELLILRGEAYIGLGQYDNAEKTFIRARQIDSFSLLSLAGLARVAIQNNQLENAASLLNQAINISKDNPDIWITMGQLYLRQSRFEDAEYAFNKAIEVEQSRDMSERKLRATVGIIISQISQEKLTEAMSNVELLRKAIPHHPYPIYLHALLLYQTKNYELARTQLLEVQKHLSNHLPTIFLLGACNYALGNYEQANSYLAMFVNVIPTHIQARKLLGASRLKLHQPELAMEVLQPITDKDLNDAKLLIMAGQAAASLGDTEIHLKYLKKAARLEPGNSSIRSELARVYLKNGAINEAIDELESFQPTNIDENRKKDLLLIYAYLRQGEYESARNKTNTILAQTPDDPGLHTLRGGIELLAGKRITARHYYLNAIALDENYIPAQISLARLETEDGDLTEASKLYHRVLLSDKNSIAAMFGLAQIAEQQGEMDLALTWVEQARKADLSAVTPRIVLAKYYLNTGKLDKALEIAKELYHISPNKPASLFILGRVQRLSGDLENSVKTLEILVAKHPDIVPAYLELANCYSQLKKYQKARDILAVGVELKPDFLQLKVAQVQLEVLAENNNHALHYAEKIQQQYKDNIVGFSLAGDIYFREKKYIQAQRAYKRALNIQQTAELIIKLARAYNAESKLAEATNVLKIGLNTFPNNIALRTALASNYHQLGEAAQAEKHYQYILDQQPENTMVLNNLALLYADKDNKQALKYAKQAYHLAPQSITISDTLGWLLVEKGEVASGLKLLKYANANSTDSTITYHHAVALVKSGESTEARNLLAKLLEKEENFKEREKARKLLTDLEK